MDRAQFHEQRRGRGQILREALRNGRRRKECVTESRNRAAHSDHEHRHERYAECEKEYALTVHARGATAGGPPGGKRGRAEKEKGVDEVQAHAKRTLHRGIVGNELEMDEPRADEGFGSHECHTHAGAPAHTVALWKGAQRPRGEKGR